MKRNGLRPIALLLFAAIVAGVVYRPDIPVPFHLWDFREFLPVLDRNPGFFDGYAALLAYYSEHGRMNPLFYLTFVVQHELFGGWAHGWQLLRFIVMLADVALLLTLALRLRLSWVGAGTVALLLVVARPAVSGWMQLMAEPIVLGLLLVAAHAALGYRDAATWRARAIVIVAAVLAALLTKEVAGALGSVVVMLAWFGWERPVRVPDLGERRHWMLGAAAGTAAVVTLGLILWIRSQPDAVGYGMAYGSGPLTLMRAADNALGMVMLVKPGGADLRGLLYPANLAALALLMLGLWSRRRRGADRRVAVRSVGFVVAMVGLGTLLYLPWPKFDAFYALPFFVGPALLLGASADELHEAGGWQRLAGIGLVALMIGYAAVPALRAKRASDAMLELNVAVTRILPMLMAGDTLVVLGPADPDRRLPVAAAELRGYPVAVGAVDEAEELPVVIDATCEAPPTGGAGMAFLTYSFGCGVLPTPGLRIISEYHWPDWVTLRSVADTLVADLIGPPVMRLVPTRR